MSNVEPALPGSPPPMPPAIPTKLCPACGASLLATGESCPRCGTRQPGAPARAKERTLAAALALLAGGLGIHKFYLGNVALGVLYLLFCWTGIPSFIGWIEGISYLLTSDEAWARQYGGPVQPANGVAIGCLWFVAVVPLLAIVSIVALVFLGAQVESSLS